MKTKTAIKIFIIITLIAIGVISYFVFFNKETQDNGEVVLPNQPNSNFFPTTENSDPEKKPSDNLENKKEGIIEIKKLRQISNNPTAGFVMFDKVATSSNALVSNNSGGETETIYRFVNKSNGNIFETTSKTTTQSRITNNTVPKIQEALFSKNGNNVIFRYLDGSDSIESYFAKIIMDENSTTTVGEGNFAELDSFFLPKNIDNINITDIGLASYTKDSSVGSNGYILDLKTPENQNISFDSKLSEIKTEWFNNNSILIGTKPSSVSGGLVFEYNLDTQKTKKILEGGTGFNFLSGYNNNKIIFSELFGSEMNSYSYNVENNQTVDLDMNTIVSDKCVWSNVDNRTIYCAVPKSKIGFGYPNLWYQGQVSFNDNLFKIDTETGLKIEVGGLVGDFDIKNIQVSESDEYITFINKKNLTLWSLDIK